MKLSSILFALACLGGSVAAAQQSDLYTIPAQSKYSLKTFVGKKPLTRAERTNFAETSHYDDVMQFLDSLKLLGAKIVVGTIGKTSQGRGQPFVIASRPLVSTPAEARALNRPIAYIQANIHAGEVEGKEAMLAMLRDLVFDPKKNVLDSIVLIVQPIYNADGNEMFGPQARNRNNQNGPELVGQRHNGQDFDLNRDYMKMDAPETRSSIAMFNAWNPDLFMDLHTTDGSIHGYSLTYSPSLSPTALTTRPYVTTTMLPVIRQRLRDRDGFEVTDYGDFSRPGARGAGGRGASLEAAVAASSPTDGWVFSTYEPFPRYGTNYYGLRGRISVLSEAFSHDPFARRVASTYDFVAEILSYVAEHSKDVMAIGTQSDAKLAAWAKDPSTSPAISLRSRMDTTRIEDVRVEAVLPLTDSTKFEPGMGQRQRTGTIKLVRMPVMVSFAPTLTTTLPFAYAFDAKTADLILPVLKLHGVQVEQLSAPATVQVKAFATDSVLHQGRAFEGPRIPSSVVGKWSEASSRSLPTGTYVVRAGQPLGLLALYLLEPQSDDGFTFWAFLDPVLAPGKEYPIVRITTPAKLSSKPVQPAHR